MKKHIAFGLVILAAVLAAMVWGTSFNVSTPLGSNAPSVLDDIDRATKLSIQERQDLDHYWPLVTNTCDAAGVGQHRWVQYAVIQTADPSVPTAGGVLYTKAVGDHAEQFFINEDSQVCQLTSGGVLNITAAAVAAADTDIVDDSTITHTAGVLKVKDAGITGAKLATADGCADNATLEVNGSSKLAIKVPAVPSTGGNIYPNAIVSPVSAYGSYAGNASSQTIIVGFNVKHLVIKRSETAKGAVEGLITSGGNYFWFQDSGNDASASVSVSGGTITLAAGDSAVNTAGDQHFWYAEGVRP